MRDRSEFQQRLSIALLGLMLVLLPLISIKLAYVYCRTHPQTYLAYQLGIEVKALGALGLIISYLVYLIVVVAGLGLWIKYHHEKSTKAQ